MILISLRPVISYKIHLADYALSERLLVVFFFAMHAHTMTTCFAVVLRLCHLNLVSLSTLLGTVSYTLVSHIHLTSLTAALLSATSFSFLTGQISVPCNIVHRTHLLFSLPVIISDISILVSNGANCLNLFHPIQILASTAVSASPSTFNISPK